MAFISEKFSYNGFTSDSMGVMLVRMSSGLIDSQFMGNRQISYDIIQGNDTPYYYGKRTEPFPVKLTICPINNGQWTRELMDEVTRWINNGKFNAFYSTDNIDRIYYLTYVGSPTLKVTGNEQGVVELDFMNMDCYVRSQTYNQIFDLSSNTGTSIIQLSNLGSANIQPDIRIQKMGTGDVTLKNLSNGGVVTGFTGLSNNEIIFIDADQRNISTDIPDTNRYDNFTKNYLTLVYGVNQIEVTGRCKLNFYYRYLFASV